MLHCTARHGTALFCAALHCFAQVLTMEFADGKRITDMQYLDACGLRRADVAQLLSEAFCTQARALPFASPRLGL